MMETSETVKLTVFIQDTMVRTMHRTDTGDTEDVRSGYNSYQREWWQKNFQIPMNQFDLKASQADLVKEICDVCSGICEDYEGDSFIASFAVKSVVNGYIITNTISITKETKEKE